MTREEIIDELCRLRSDIMNAGGYVNRTDVQKNRFAQALSEEIQRLQTEQKIIRCCQCKYAEVADSEDSQDGYTCQFHRGSIWFSRSYCSWAERRQDG